MDPYTLRFVVLPMALLIALAIVGYKWPSVPVGTFLAFIAIFCIGAFMVGILIPHLFYGVALIGYLSGTGIKLNK